MASFEDTITQSQCNISCKYSLCGFIFTAHVWSTMGGYIFSLSVCSPGVGWGLPHLQPIILFHPKIIPLVPCPFRGVPSGQGRMGVTKAWGQQDWGTPPPLDRFCLDRLCLDRLCCGWYAFCGFPAGGLSYWLLVWSSWSLLSYKIYRSSKISKCH